MSLPVNDIPPDLTPKRADWRKVFLNRLAEHGCVGIAAKEAGRTKETAYAHYHKFPRFQKAWENALGEFTESLEKRASERAKAEMSDVLMIFLLKANKPEKYRDNTQNTALPSASRISKGRNALRKRLLERAPGTNGNGHP